MEGNAMVQLSVDERCFTVPCNLLLGTLPAASLFVKLLQDQSCESKIARWHNGRLVFQIPESILEAIINHLRLIYTLEIPKMPIVCNNLMDYEITMLYCKKLGISGLVT